MTSSICEAAPTVKQLRSIVHSSELTVMYLQLGGWRHGHRSGMRRLRARVRSPRRVDQRPSASGLASHYGPRVDGHREQTKRSRVNIARLSDGIAALISREPSCDWEQSRAERRGVDTDPV